MLRQDPITGAYYSADPRTEEVEVKEVQRASKLEAHQKKSSMNKDLSDQQELRELGQYQNRLKADYSSQKDFQNTLEAGIPSVE